LTKSHPEFGGLLFRVADDNQINIKQAISLALVELRF